MKKDILFFGTGKIGEVISYYARNECGFTIAAFCVDEKFRNQERFHDIPVVPFEGVEKQYPPEKFDMFIGVGYQDLNKLRELKCQEAIAKGYSLVSIISPRSNVPSDVSVGWNCFIMPPCIVHPCVKIGNNVFIWSGAMVAHHSVVEDNCWLTSCCNISGNVRIGQNTFVAVNATVGHTVSIGKHCFLGANTLITKNLEDEKAVIVESTKPIRLTSTQFIRMADFSSL